MNESKQTPAPGELSDIGEDVAAGRISEREAIRLSNTSSAHKPSAIELESLGEWALLYKGLPDPCRITAHWLIARSKQIVRDLNSHDELLAACKAAESAIGSLPVETQMPSEIVRAIHGAYDSLRFAIARAEGRIE